jgi:cytochrome P450
MPQRTTPCTSSTSATSPSAGRCPEPAALDGGADAEEHTRVQSIIDLSDHDLFVDHAPHELFDRLRTESPVYWNAERPPRHGFWAVTRYDDILRVLKDTATFSSAAGGITLEEPSPDELDARRNFLELDPPQHGRFRKVLAPDFTPRAVGKWEEWLRALVVRTLDEALPKGEIDFVEEIAAPVPIRVLGHIMGVPEEHHDRLITLSDRLINNNDPELASALADSEDSDAFRYEPFRSPDAQEIVAIGRELFDKRRAEPQEDVISYLVNASPDGGPYTERELEINFVTMVVAGNETTRSAMGQGALAFCQNPDQWQLLRSRPELAQGAADEMIRYASPVWHFRRTATRDVELGGQQIRQGDKVVVWFASANRDPDVFGDPHRFDITRPPSKHLHCAFGRGGPHYCLGAHLATMEVRVLLEELIPRMAAIELAGEPRRVRSNFANGLKTLPVRVTLA